MTCNHKFNKWKQYPSLPGFENLYLEDGYVIDISHESNKIEFLMEFVLLETHPLYDGVLLGEQYCYQEGTILFENVSRINKFIKKNIIIYDANGERDIGNIDTFISKNSQYILRGEWGELDIVCENPRIAYI